MLTKSALNCTSKSVNFTVYKLYPKLSESTMEKEGLVLNHNRY